MSSEPLGINQLKNPKIYNMDVTNKVDINLLMAKVREEEKKQKKENFLILGLISSVLVATGIIASL